MTLAKLERIGPNWPDAAGVQAWADMQVILVIHRHLGVVVGLLMTVWCLSGFVMMYQAYPTLTPEERFRTLDPIRFDPGCCDPAKLGFGADDLVDDFRIEMLAGRPPLAPPAHAFCGQVGV